MSFKSNLESLIDKADITSVSILELIIKTGSDYNCSDIHIDPSVSGASVRVRIDGVLVEGCQLMRETYQEIISFIKVSAHLKIDDHYTPKDGSFELAHLMIRVSLMHTHQGENVVMRIIKKEQKVTLVDLGFDENSIKTIQDFISRPSGIVIISGPTGSGKSTTLYTLLSLFKNSGKNIVTLEDPIEMKLPEVRQIDFNASRSKSFSDMLRHILRQDPDIIMVGEIRDRETAELVFEISLTGHMVFSTIHVNDLRLFEKRLVSMGVASYLIQAVPTLLIGQELVKKLCGCSEGCGLCNQKKYRGRTVIYELSDSTQTKRDCAFQKAQQGVISYEDATRFDTVLSS